MAEPEPWRKTGRKAKDDHWLGLAPDVLVELAVYDDRGNQQGRMVAQLKVKGDMAAREEGQVWLAKVLGIEDPYFDWWFQQTYGENQVPLHACSRQAFQCRAGTLYRNPLHMDVFRVLPGRTAMGLSWLSDEKKNVEAALPAISSGEVAPEPHGSGGVLVRGEATVATGEEGIRGLADALGSKPRAEAKDVDEERPVPKRQKKAAGEDKEKPEGSGRLQEVLQERTAAAPELSALKMPRGKKESGKKKKKKRGAKAKKRTQKSGDSSSSSSSNSGSSEGSVFRLAALPQGVEKLQRLHQERPGTLANLTLRRFSELLNRSVGGGSAGSASDLPPTARAYLTQIYLVKNPEPSLGLRNLRELRTLAAMVDLMASNDTLRALDIALQRMKAIEVFVAQGNWTQATMLELVPAEGEQRAWFRQELKAAQQEAKAESKMLQDQWSRRRRTWEGGTGGGVPPNNETKGDAEKGDTPPNNGPKGRKGKGKGKKGKRW